MLVEESEVGCWKSKGAAESAAFDDRAENGVRSAQEGSCKGQVSSGDRLTHPGAADGALNLGEFTDSDGFKVVQLPEFLEKSEIAFAALPETPSLTHADSG